MRGYTLLELIVAVGIFSLVMLAATGAYIALINVDRQARAVNDVVTNLSFAVDTMGREIRTGTDYKCGNLSGASANCSTPRSSFGFVDSSGRTVLYSQEGGQIIATIDGVTSPLTDPRITVETLSFYVRGVGTGDDMQPQATVAIYGTIDTGHGNSTSLSVQVGATQRLLEL